MDLKAAIGVVEEELDAERSDAAGDLTRGAHTHDGVDRPNTMQMERTQVAVIAGAQLARYALHVALTQSAEDLDTARSKALAFLPTDEGMAMAGLLRDGVMKTCKLTDNRSVPPHRVIRTAANMIRCYLEDDDVPARDDETYGQAVRRLHAREELTEKDASVLRNKFCDACARVLLDGLALMGVDKLQSAATRRELYLAALRLPETFDVAMRIWKEVQARFQARHVVSVHRIVERARDLAEDLYPEDEDDSNTDGGDGPGVTG